MHSFDKMEFRIMETLYSRDVDGNSDLMLQSESIPFKETDPMNRIRELVFHIEELEREGYVVTEPDFYDSSDHMSFTYLNSATELYETRVRLSDEGMKLVETFRMHHASIGLGQAFQHTMESKGGKMVVGIVALVFVLIGFVAGYCVGRL